MFDQTETIEVVDEHLKTIGLINKHMSLGLRSQSLALCLKPFYRTHDSRDPLLGSRKLDEEEVSKEFPILSSTTQRTVYKSEIERLPSDTELIQGTTPIRWQSVVEQVGLSSLQELNLALRTGIGALKSQHAREDLRNRLNEFCQHAKLFQPTEGFFDPLSKKSIFENLVSRRSAVLTVIDEYLESRKTINVGDQDMLSFSRTIGFKDYYLVESDHSVLWSMGWDDFYFLLDGPKPIVDAILSTGTIEGFYLSAS